MVVEELERSELHSQELGVDMDRYDRESETFARVEAGLIRRSHE